MGMQGFDRVIVEPSGIYDVDEFFDVLHEEPLDRWYEIGNVIAILDIHMLENSLSREARYFIMSQASQAGILVLSHVQELEDSERKDTTAFINGIMKEFGCDRRYKKEDIRRISPKISLFCSFISFHMFLEEYWRTIRIRYISFHQLKDHPGSPPPDSIRAHGSRPHPKLPDSA